MALKGTIIRSKEDLRTVPAKDIAESNASARKPLIALEKHYRGNPKVQFKVIDNAQLHSPTLSVDDFTKRPYDPPSIEEAKKLAKHYIDIYGNDIPPNARKRILGDVVR